MWIIGGAPDNKEQDFLNAVWNYDPVNDQYRWVAGNATVGSQYVKFGEMGVPGPDVFPGFLDFSSHAIDLNDNIWIYGGETADYNYNTMWMFNTSSLQFTWIGGDETNLISVAGDLGQSSPKYWPGSLEGACMVFDSKNNLWMFGGYRDWCRNGVWQYNTKSRHWSLQSGDLANSNQYPNFETNFWPGRWSAGCTIDDEDRVWVFGGFASTTPFETWNDMWSFDTKTGTWRVELPFKLTNNAGSVVSFDTYDAKNYPSARDRSGMVDRRDGTIMLVGGYDREGELPYNDIWVYHKTSKLWKIVFGLGNNSTLVNSTYGEHGADEGSKLGSRMDHAVENGLTSNGHVIVFGGEDGTRVFNDIWVIPQELCLACDPNASCVTKSTWNYQCICKEGYVGNGNTCTSPTSQPGSNQSPSVQPTATPTSTMSAASSVFASFSVCAGLLALVW